MTPQERLVQATQDLAVAKSKLESAVNADNISIKLPTNPFSSHLPHISIKLPFKIHSKSF